MSDLDELRILLRELDYALFDYRLLAEDYGSATPRDR